ncbi:hypothetical protein VTN77DRAFT_4457 [Rasamsonia byssochlamydoides]|uniref:uncharacterized protein n=1 Tax=Rasamsonia byssochlamydoides TaxID=89139 RepID=UPI003741E910
MAALLSRTISRSSPYGGYKIRGLSDGTMVVPLLSCQLPRGVLKFSRGYMSRTGSGSASTQESTRYRHRRRQGELLLTAPVIPNPVSPLVWSSRGYADLKPTSGKSEADLLVEELQELYDAAKDEFEIATDSTNAATIYAASDRESARDALNHLTRVYTLYTEMTTSSAPDTPAKVFEGETAPVPMEPVLQNPQDRIAEGRTDPLLSGDPAAGPPMQGEAEGMDRIAPNYDPEDIQPEVREEVKRRVGQRIRELQNAVAALEERARAESG